MYVDGIRTRTIQAGEGPDLILMHGEVVTPKPSHATCRRCRVISGCMRWICWVTVSPVLAMSPGAKGLCQSPSRIHGPGRYRSSPLVGRVVEGWIAAWTALEHRDRVDRLIYVCGARLTLQVGADAEARTAAGRAELARLTQQFLADPSPANVRERMAWLFHQPDRDLTDELVALRWALYETEESRSAMTNATAPPSAATAQDNLTAERLAGLSTPTLVLWTSHNPSATVDFGRRAAELIPDAEFALMEDCGHWPQWERPEEFNQIITDYLNGDRASRGQG